MTCNKGNKMLSAMCYLPIPEIINKRRYGVDPTFRSTIHLIFAADIFFFKAPVHQQLLRRGNKGDQEKTKK
jgi:hypothetical protein